MTVTVTAPPATVRWSGSGQISTTAADGAGTQVWVTGVGGPRLVQVPAEAIVDVSWQETLTEGVVSKSATLVLRRYWLLDDEDPGSWLANEVVPRRDRIRELQIVHRGKVSFWGPVLRAPRSLGDPEVSTSSSGCEWWMGVRLMRAQGPVQWGREWLRNHQFSQGLSAWARQRWTGGSPSVTDGVLDIDAATFTQAIWVFWRGTWRLTARVFVPSSVDDDEPILTLEAPGGLRWPRVRTQVLARSATRDQWSTIVLTADVDGGSPGQLGRAIEVSISGPDGVLFDEVSLQLSPESIGESPLPQQVVYVPQSTAWFALIQGALADLDISASVTGELVASRWWVPNGTVHRPDMYASEVARQMTATGTAEAEMVYTPSMRVGVMHASGTLIGVEHDPEVLSLTARRGDRVVADAKWETGVDRPVTEVVMVHETGVSGSFHDPTRFGGVRMQRFEAAPTGTSEASLVPIARQKVLAAATGLAERWTVDVDAALTDTLGIGDRVWFVFDDGPDQFAGWTRVVHRDIKPADPTMTVHLELWEPES